MNGVRETVDFILLFCRIPQVTGKKIFPVTKGIEQDLVQQDISSCLVLSLSEKSCPIPFQKSRVTADSVIFGSDFDIQHSVVSCPVDLVNSPGYNYFHVLMSVAE